MTVRKLAVVSAGLSVPSSTRLLADRLAAATRRSLESQGFRVEVEPVELRDHGHDLINNLLAGFPSGSLGKAIDGVVGADGLIAVSPIFNASYSGLFKTFFDVLEAGSLAGKPVLIAATGGTARHSLALEHAMRPMFAYLRSVVVPTAVYAASEDWGKGADGDARALTERVSLAAGELATLIGDRMPSGRPDPYAEPTPFEDLLAGG
ncbi:FMN reductase [Actinomadura sp. HBU206391]|uniref:FMN reductase n=1 Tax=Actinomadura sp. HBU206391 TaxID=2731692 RepID=UPI00164FAF43|nr:FMN reductase [Actinomadura sp. HBU206391]MBC6459180.1 FMN reductase [Actinomadura sp. HBU206391]